jgi:hypothetical protein
MAMNAREIKKRADERAVRAAELRRAGLTFREIGQILGPLPVTVETARLAVLKGERILARRLNRPAMIGG